MSVYRTWAYDDVGWGETRCDAPRCVNEAELLADGEARCVGCADRELERLNAAGLAPGVSWPPLYG